VPYKRESVDDFFEYGVGNSGRKLLIGEKTPHNRKKGREIYLSKGRSSFYSEETPRLAPEVRQSRLVKTAGGSEKKQL